MIVTRFCSQAEYDKYLRGETLTNTTDHYKGGRGGSTSVGFCFSKDAPEIAWRYLKGIVDYDVCMVLEIEDCLLTQTKGKYWDYVANNGQCCFLTEYCIKEYSNKTAILRKALMPEEFATPEELIALEFYKPIMRKIT